MKLYEALDIDIDRDELLCFVGAGGKTISMFKLARELRGYKKRVLVTATTAIFYPDEGDCDKVIVNSLQNVGMFTDIPEGSITCFGKEHSHENKLLGADKEFVEELYKEKIFDYILVEGDGSKRKPIKAPDFYEPVIPGNTTKIIGVIGLDSIGKSIDSKHVHRPELFCKLTGTSFGDVIGEKEIVSIILSPEGLFKAVPENCQKYLLLNKSENEERERSAMHIIDLVKKNGICINGFIIASMVDGRIKTIK